MVDQAADIIDFNPRSPCGERRANGRQRPAVVSGFQSTLPVWGATSFSSVNTSKIGFQSTLPVWGATGCAGGSNGASKFQSTLPVWGATVDPILDI